MLKKLDTKKLNKVHWWQVFEIKVIMNIDCFQVWIEPENVFGEPNFELAAAGGQLWAVRSSEGSPEREEAALFHHKHPEQPGGSWVTWRGQIRGELRYKPIVLIWFLLKWPGGTVYSILVSHPATGVRIPAFPKLLQKKFWSCRGKMTARLEQWTAAWKRWPNPSSSGNSVASGKLVLQKTSSTY